MKSAGQTDTQTDRACRLVYRRDKINKNQYFLEQAEWKEIITLFGGTCPDKMTGDTYWEAGPYWSMEWDYVHEYRDRQNKPWILYYPDSDVCFCPDFFNQKIERHSSAMDQ